MYKCTVDRHTHNTSTQSPTCTSIHSMSHTQGSDSEVTRSAQKMLEGCEIEVKKVERELEQLEAEINPALDDNALVAFSYLLKKVIEEMKSVPEVDQMSSLHGCCVNGCVSHPLSRGRSTIPSLPGKYPTTTKSLRNPWICKQC